MTLHALELQIMKSIILGRNLEELQISSPTRVALSRLDSKSFAKLTKDDSQMPNLLKTKLTINKNSDDEDDNQDDESYNENPWGF